MVFKLVECDLDNGGEVISGPIYSSLMRYSFIKILDFAHFCARTANVPFFLALGLAWSWALPV